MIIGAVAASLVEESRPTLTFLCNPNNPTGVYPGRPEVATVPRQSGTPGSSWWTRAYSAFLERPWDTRGLLECGKVILLRSMTKDHALPGLRLGYMPAPEPLIEEVRRFHP